MTNESLKDSAAQHGDSARSGNRNSRFFLLLAFVVACAPMPTEPEPEPEPEQPSGTPDLAIEAFIPPVIFAGPGDTIYISDLTSNIGYGPSAPTVVRYYISDTSPIDIHSAVVIGERQLQALAVKERNESLEVPFVIPDGAGRPPFYLAACVDVDDLLIEVYEENNCTVNRSGNHQMPFDSGMVVPNEAETN